MLFAHQGTKGTLTTVEVATIHVLQLRGKRGFVVSLRTYLMFFLPSSGRIPPNTRAKFCLAFRQIKEFLKNTRPLAGALLV